MNCYRYEKAGVSHTHGIYVDCGCCRQTENPTQLMTLFHPWTTPIRLDIFHFIQRFRFCCATESHPLNAEFMGRLSSSILEWDKDDMDLLISAKRGVIGETLSSDYEVGTALICHIGFPLMYKCLAWDCAELAINLE